MGILSFYFPVNLKGWNHFSELLKSDFSRAVIKGLVPLEFNEE